MKFLYGYKTRDNETRDGVICAPSRDVAYKVLKEKGIRPFKVELAPGLLNLLQSYGKRVYAIVVLAIALAAMGSYIALSRARLTADTESPQPRHQIYGDPALMGDAARTNYKTVFSHAGHQFLAHFAQPGATVPSEVRAIEDDSALHTALRECLDVPIVFSSGEPREYNELKRIMITMTQELRRYLSNGIGTPARYVKRLEQRQSREMDIYMRAKRDIERGESSERCDRINESLRAIGLKTIILTESDQEKM